MAESDRRHFPRQNEETAIQVLLAPDHSNGRKDSYDLLPAKLRNQSGEGFYIEIDHSLQPGSTLSIQMTPPMEDHPKKLTTRTMGGLYGVKKSMKKNPVLEVA